MFRDRKEAGEALAAELARRFEKNPPPGPPVVLALPRGGAPVAIEVARRLDAPLDLVLVRKVGAPGQPELAAAAVVNGDDPVLVKNEDVISALGIGKAELEAAKRREMAEIERRREAYFAGRKRPEIEGATAIVIDDGVATGATARAALRAMRRRNPARLILAVPVAAQDTLRDLEREVDEVVCLSAPAFFMAVGAHYANFDQTSDAEVIRLLDEAAAFGAGRKTEGGDGAA